MSAGIKYGECPIAYKKTELGVLPEDWEVLPIGKTGQVIGGRQQTVSALFR